MRWVGSGGKDRPIESRAPLPTDRSFFTGLPRIAAQSDLTCARIRPSQRNTWPIVLVRDIRVRAIGPGSFYSVLPTPLSPCCCCCCSFIRDLSAISSLSSTPRFLPSPPPLIALCPPSCRRSRLALALALAVRSFPPPSTSPPVHLTFRSRKDRGNHAGVLSWVFSDRWKELDLQEGNPLFPQPLTASVRARNEPASPNSSGAGKGDPEDLELLAALRGFPIRVFNLWLP